MVGGVARTGRNLWGLAARPLLADTRTIPVLHALVAARAGGGTGAAAAEGGKGGELGGKWTGPSGEA